MDIDGRDDAPRTQSHSKASQSAQSAGHANENENANENNNENNENNNDNNDTSASRSPPATDPVDVSTMFIKNAQNFTSALRRLNAHNDAMIFWNDARDLKLMIRADMSEEDDEWMTFDFVIVYDAESDRSGTRFELMDLEHDGYYDDDEDLFFIDDFRMPKCPSFDNEDTIKAMNLINKFYTTRVCPCSKYLIKNGEASCTYCLLTADAKDAVEFTCPICLDTIFGCHAVCQPCCSTHLHRACLDTWSNQSMDSARRCPLCRA
jgi:hypothetical protein